MAQLKVLDQSALLYLWQKIMNKFVAKETGKGLSSNDYTTEEKTKLGNLSNYTLPAATSDSLGGVKVGAGLEITNNGVLNATGGGTADAVDWDNVQNKPSTYAPSTHTHAQSDITDLSTALAGKAAATHTHAQSDITDLSTTLAGKIASTEKGANSGVATLNSSGKLTATQIPSNVVLLDSSTNMIPSNLIPGAFEDVVDGYYDTTTGKFYSDSAKTTEMTGADLVTGRFYVDLTLDSSNNPKLTQYRYSGSAFVPVATYVTAMDNNDIDSAIQSAESV